MGEWNSRSIHQGYEPSVNSLLNDFSRVGTVEIQELYTNNPSWRRLPLQSYPHLSTYPDHLVGAAAIASHEPRNLPPLGLESLCSRLALDLGREVSAPIDSSNVAVTNGAQSALQLIWLVLLNRGDEVVVPTPNYYVEGSIRLAGGVFNPVPAMSAEAIDWDRIEGALKPSTKALFLTNPNNPVGYLMKPKDISILEKLLEANPGLWAVIDESYERIRHDGRPHHAAWTSPILRERSIMVRSLSKSFALTWLRVGWLAAPTVLIPFLLKVIEWQQLYGSSYLNQAVALAALQGDKQWLEPAFSGYSEGRDILYKILSNIKGCKVGLPEAGPFLFPDISGLGGRRSEIIANLRRSGIPAVDGQYFGVSSDHFRFPVGGDAETLSEAASIITATFSR